jgi:integrin beta 3
MGPPQKIVVEPPPLRPAGEHGPRSALGGLAAGVDLVQGARSELRKQMREHQRLRMWTMIAVVVTLLGAIPLYLMIQAATRDPVFNSLDALNLPSWATQQIDDQSDGSRWCIIECRYRERSAHSEKEFKETADVYESALVDAGWQKWTPELCPDESLKGKGVYTCWRRDEFTLDLWVRPPACADNPYYNRPTIAPTEGGAAGASPAPVDPSAATCTGSDVLVKVTNAIEDHRQVGGTSEPNPDVDLGDLDPSATPDPSNPAFDPTALPGD